MTYLDRTLEKTVISVSKSFPVLLLTGPRQVGKTTLLKELQKSSRSYVSLDDPMDRAMAKEDPGLFLQNYTPPLLIDEIQYAPELLPYIKLAVDRERQPGMYWLTGSQQFHLMKHVTESLAGRIAILNLLGFSLAEEFGNSNSSEAFVPELRQIQNRSKSAKSLPLPDLYRRIWRGSFPFLVANNEPDWEIFYKSYVQSYLQRDLRDFASISDEQIFLKFLRTAAARTGQLINYADMASDVGVSEPTIKSWITILVATGLVYILEPYHTNLSKRLVKTPKLIFLDTGLCAYLTGWSNPTVLEHGAMSGAFFETFVIAELIKSYWHNGRNAPIFFYRDRDKKEIDLLIEKDGTLFPIEIKKASAPSGATGNFNTLEKLSVPIGHGAVICMADHHKAITKSVTAVPVSYLSV